ncbi:MAG: glycosyltransferase [Phenylobacterium sp.]|nr:glycosyltransferase [Phenylobacterium sp.]
MGESSLGGPDLALLSRVPLSAQCVRYIGAEPEAFEAAYRARNPNARFADAGAPDVPSDILVLDDLGRLAADLSLAGGLAPGGYLVATIPPDRLAQARYLVAMADAMGVGVLQLQPAVTATDQFDDRETNLASGWRTWEAPPDVAHGGLVFVGRKGGPEQAPLHVRLVAFAPRMLDIRTRLPANASRSDPGVVFAYQTRLDRLPPVPREEPKVLIIQRSAQIDPDFLRTGMASCIRAGWLVVSEFDDHPELVAAVTGDTVGPEHWRRFGYTHAVQTSTPDLAALIGRYNPDVKVFPNAVFDLEPFPEPRPRRVFYGAIGRGPFARDVAGSLTSVTREFPDVEFVVVRDREVFDALPTRRKRFYDLMPYEDYLRLMATCCVSLAPMEDREHMATKSDAKFLDGASRGVVTLASPTVYSATISHGENGLIAQELGDWAPLLAETLRDKPLRMRLARNAWEYVRDRRMFAYQLPERTAWLRELAARRQELNAALVARVPGLAEAIGR